MPTSALTRVSRRLGAVTAPALLSPGFPAACCTSRRRRRCFTATLAPRGERYPSAPVLVLPALEDQFGAPLAGAAFIHGSASLLEDTCRTWYAYLLDDDSSLRDHSPHSAAEHFTSTVLPRTSARA